LYGDLNPYYSISNLGFNFGHVKSGADNGTQCSDIVALQRYTRRK